MKFYRGLVDIGHAPVKTQIQRGFRPMTFNKDKRQVQIANAAPVDPMSAAEVVILRSLHGEDSVTELYEVGEKKQMSFAAARDHLEQTYGEKAVAAVFGPRGAGNRLPREVENVEPEPEDEPIEVNLSVKLDDDDEFDGEDAAIDPSAAEGRAAAPAA